MLSKSKERDLHLIDGELNYMPAILIGIALSEIGDKLKSNAAYSLCNSLFINKNSDWPTVLGTIDSG